MHGGLPKILALLVALLMMVGISGCLGPEEDLEDQGDDPGDADDDEAPDPEPEPQPNEAVSGPNVSCVEAFATNELDEMTPLGDVYAVAVEPDTGWKAEGEGARVHVEFFSADGSYLDHGDDEGIVPSGAAYGAPCIFDAQGVPLPHAMWTYQDGF